METERRSFASFTETISGSGQNPRWLIGDQVTGDTGRRPLMAAAVKP